MSFFPLVCAYSSREFEESLFSPNSLYWYYKLVQDLKFSFPYDPSPQIDYKILVLNQYKDYTDYLSSNLGKGNLPLAKHFYWTLPQMKVTLKDVNEMNSRKTYFFMTLWGSPNLEVQEWLLEEKFPPYQVPRLVEGACAKASEENLLRLIENLQARKELSRSDWLPNFSLLYQRDLHRVLDLLRDYIGFDISFLYFVLSRGEIYLDQAQSPEVLESLRKIMGLPPQGFLSYFKIRNGLSELSIEVLKAILEVYEFPSPQFLSLISANVDPKTLIYLLEFVGKNETDRTRYEIEGLAYRLEYLPHPNQEENLRVLLKFHPWLREAGPKADLEYFQSRKYYTPFTTEYALDRYLRDDLDPKDLLPYLRVTKIHDSYLGRPDFIKGLFKRQSHLFEDPENRKAIFKSIRRVARDRKDLPWKEKRSYFEVLKFLSENLKGYEASYQSFKSFLLDFSLIHELDYFVDYSTQKYNNFVRRYYQSILDIFKTKKGTLTTLSLMDKLREIYPEILEDTRLPKLSVGLESQEARDPPGGGW